jgi:V/A-type H+-transporting ATPase subunit E
MDEQLQSLLDRIQKDGVEKAEAQAAEIVAAARVEAARIVDEAKRTAAEQSARAEQDAKRFLERSTTTLEQTGRDFLLQLRAAIERVLEESAKEAVGEGLNPETMAAMLEHLANAYAARDFNEHRIEVLVSLEDRQRFVELVFARYRKLLGEGLTIQVDDRLQGGFKVSLVDYRLYHDFTVEAIAEALSALLKPPMDDIVRRAAGPATQEPA